MDEIKKLLAIIVKYNHSESIFDEIGKAFPKWESFLREVYQEEWGESLEEALERRGQ